MNLSETRIDNMGFSVTSCSEDCIRSPVTYGREMWPGSLRRHWAFSIQPKIPKISNEQHMVQNFRKANHSTENSRRKSTEKEIPGKKFSKIWVYLARLPSFSGNFGK